MNELDVQDINWIARRLPPPVLTALRKHGTNLFLAGGFIRACVANEQINDVDLFTSSPDLAKQVADELAAAVRHGSVHSTDNAYTVRGCYLPVQVIHRWTFDDPRKCVESFDFTIARAAFWFSQEKNGSPETYCDSRFYSDLAGKRLVYCRPQRDEEAGGSMLRVLKFYQRGYRIPLDSLGAVIARLAQAVCYDEIAKAAYTQGVSNEQQIAKVLTGLLHEVDPNVDPLHLSHLPALEA